ncbi:MAG: RNA-binding cell elongation regulator Jag/EloR [Solirubrobacterales bacterium]
MGADEQTATLPGDPAERVRAVLERVLEGLGLAGRVQTTEDEETITATVDGEELGLLIGRHGQTIDAIQLVCFQAAFRGMRERKRVIVDAAGYREQRREALEKRADRISEQALSEDRAVELEPMNAAERRVIHEYLREKAGIETYSEGDEPHRFVVVAPLIAD